MSSPSKQRQLSANGQLLDSSNSTSAYFVGNVQRSWMSQAPVSNGLTPRTEGPRVSTLPTQSTATHRHSKDALLQSQQVLTVCGNIGDNPTLAHQLASPDPNDAVGTVKRPRTIEENSTLIRPIAQSSNCTKRLRLDRPKIIGEHLIEEATATLPSPPIDGIAVEGECRAPVNDATFKPVSRTIGLGITHCFPLGDQSSISNVDTIPPAVEPDETASSFTTTAQTRSPPVEAANTGTYTAGIGTTASQESNSLMANTPVQERSRNCSPSSTNVGESLRENQAKHYSKRASPATLSLYFARLYGEVSTRLGWVMGQPERSPIELARLRLLQQACHAEDEFFLVIHQFYCNKNNLMERGDVTESITEGFQVLQRLLASNDQMTPSAVQWFTTFAKSPLKADQEKLEHQVWDFLSMFPVLWSRLLSSYPCYKIPPSSFAMMIHIPGLTSVVFQQVIFRALLRTSWVEPHDACVEKCEKVFTYDQQRVQMFLRDHHPGDISNNFALSQLDKMATQNIRRIMVSHHNHSVDSHNTTKHYGSSQAAPISSSSTPDSAITTQNPYHSTAETHTAKRPRPSSPNLNTQAIGHSSGGQQTREAGSSSSPLGGPCSAPLVNENRSSYPIQSSSPSTPAMGSNRHMSLPTFLTQSPQLSAPYIPAFAPGNNSGRRYTQLPPTVQTFLPTNIITLPNNTQGQLTHNFTIASPAALEQQEFRAQQAPQLHQTLPVQQGTQFQPTLQIRQVIQRQQAAQPQYVSQMEQAAQMRQGLVIEQHSCVQEPTCGGPASSSALPSLPRLPVAAHSHEGQIPQMGLFRNASSSARPTFRQPSTVQRTLSYPPQTNSNGGFAVGHPTAYMSVASNPAVVSYPENFGAPPHLRCKDQFICNMAGSLPQVPNPAVTALHQAHAKSPQLGFWDPNISSCEIKAFRYIKHVFFCKALTAGMKSLQWMEKIDENVIEKLPKDITGPVGLPFRQVSNGSYLARVRCIKLKDSDQLPGDSLWATSDMSWPPFIAVSVNGQFLETRRKSHFGKDLPVDVTRILKPGQNEFSASIMGLPIECTDQWLVGLEFAEVIDTASVKQMLTHQTSQYCRDRILDKLRSKDDEIEMVEPQIVLNMTDPFTSRIFDTPVRGRDCAHNQCFDLDTFLQTRGAVTKPEPCPAEDFRCPLCKGDVRPHVMVVDGFLAFLRSELEKRGRLDVKAVILRENGAWEIKEEEVNIKEDPDRVPKGPVTGPDDDRVGVTHVERFVSQKDDGKTPGRAAVEVIVLDDD